VNLDSDAVWKFLNTNLSDATARMAVNIAETLLDDPEDGGFNVGGEARQIVGNIDIDLDAAALRESFDVGQQRRAETGFVEQRRMQQIGDGANFGEAQLYEFDGIDDAGFVLLRKRDGIAKSAEIHLNGGEILANAIVKIASNAAAFLILSRKNPSGELAKLGSTGFDARFEFIVRALQLVLIPARFSDIPIEADVANNGARLLVNGENRDIDNAAVTWADDRQFR